jgi:sortase B
MFYADDFNEFYLRKDFDKNYLWEGSYFADFRSKWGDGTRDGLSSNTVIYGHSMEDDPNAPLFSQLKKYLTEDFARQNPYLYFSTTEEDMAWEVFAVYYTTIHEVYNTPDFETPEKYDAIIKDAQARSLYLYEDLEVTPQDKIITLSTCCYNYTSSYPNDYRYVIMAKLVEKDAALKEEAALTANPSPKQPN